MRRSMREEAVARRDGAVSMAMKRKEEYLGARVPKELRDRVIARANDMGIPVSILMRNILEDAFSNHTSKGASEACVTLDGGKESLAGKFDTVIGWDRIVLNKSVPCTNCGVELCVGKDVTLGLGAAQPVILCDTCRSDI